MKVELTARQRETVLNRIWQAYEWGKAERTKHESDWKNARKQYNSEWQELRQVQPDEDLDQWFFVPKTFTHVHRVLCALGQHFFPRNKRKLAKVSPPVTKGLLPIAAAVGDDVLHSKLDLIGRPDVSMPALWETALLESHGWLTVSWQSGPVNGPRIEHVPNEHIVFDPYARTDRDIRWVIHEIWLTEDEIWALKAEDVFENVGKLPRGVDETREDTWLEGVSGPGGRPNYKYKLIEYWGPIQIRSDEELDSLHAKGKHEPEIDVVATLYKNEVLLRIDDNPYAKLFEVSDALRKLPFFKCTPLPRANTAWGDSFALRIKPIQREINTLRNQRRLAVEGELNRKTFFDQNRLTDLERAYAARYGGMVPVNGPPGDVVKDFAPITSTGALYQEEQLMDDDLRDATGVTYWHTGSTVPGMQKTATGANLITSEGNVKLDTIIWNVAATSVLPVAEFTMQCVAEYCTAEEVQEIIGSATPPPWDAMKLLLTKEFRVELESGPSATSKEADIANQQTTLSYLAQIANAMPQQAMAAFNVVMPRLLCNLGMPEAAAVFTQSAEVAAGAAAPAGQQVEGPPNAGYARQAALQGRRRTPQEVAV